MQLTLRSDDPALEQAIRAHARARGVSLNRAAVELLLQSLELTPEPPDRRIGARLDHLAGTWSEEEADAFDRAVADLARIDDEMWR